jgi:type II secretory pathway component PulF
MVTQMIMVGEQTGEVENMLKELADYYSNEVDMTMKNFSTIIEPVIILALGLAVAGVAVAVIMPMYSLAQSF